MNVDFVDYFRIGNCGMNHECQHFSFTTTLAMHCIMLSTAVARMSLSVSTDYSAVEVNFFFMGGHRVTLITTHCNFGLPILIPSACCLHFYAG